ncbi:hypothetical protein N0V85_008477 [Neurospora sp. IMI 360204]|nr:hypothetical protein N0V85_008477 [Neurospora sp. IMI 360204]
MSLYRQKRSPFSSRPFIVSTLLITCLATYALVLRPFATSRLLRQPEQYQQQQQQHVAQILARGHHKHEPTAPVDCRDVHLAQDQCAFTLAHCEDEEAGLIHYLSFYYCTLPNAKPVAFAVLTAWLGLLFTTIGIAASDFFSINLSTISSVLGLSENLAGVTFLALGNGSPDVFSTFAAMSSNSGSMAVGELIGAAGFITAVVAGSMGLVREFKVQKRTFVRDIVYFIIAISFTMLFLLDQELHLWEANAMVGCYVVYVILVFAWQWFTDRRRKTRQREAAARTHYHGSASSEELEAYRDDPDDDEAASVNTRPRTAQTDISALERGPRIEVEGQGVVASTPSEEEEDEQRDLHVAAEMTSSMRVNRPRWGRSNSTITPIRPSLVGALEFRSILSSIQKERNVQGGYFRGHRRGNSDYFSNQPSLPLIPEDQLYRGRQYTLDTLPTLSTIASGRDRALSSGHSPLNLNNSGLPAIQSGSETETGDTSPLLAPGPRPNESPNLRPDTRGSSTTRTVDGRLAPPLDTGGVNQGLLQHQWRKTPRTLGLHLQIPESTASSNRASPTLSPFPMFSESPTMLTPQQLPESAFVFPTPSERRRSSIAIFGGYEEEEEPLKYWPYSILPPPHIFFGTLFPTLQGWSEKSWWDKLVSLISAPSVFVLAITLPVVETESEQDEDDEVQGPAESPATHLIHGHGQPGHMAVPVSMESSAHIRPETEWQEFRRRTRSASNRSPMRSPLARSPLHSPLTASPSFVTLASPRTRLNSEARAHTNGHTNLGAQVQQAMKLNPHQRYGHSRHGSQPTIIEEDEHGAITNTGATTLADNHNDTNDTNDDNENEEKASEEGWNRWLISLQLFTGPLFVVLIIWVNKMDDLPSPGRTLLKMTLYSLIFSLFCLGILLLTTSADRKPKYHFLLCFLGFVISIAWISTIANEVVGILKAVGVILGISEAILGLTIFAVGNSLGDLVADVTVARLGWPVMALAACFGGPMLNILLGIGLGGAWMIVSSANKHHAKHPELPFKYKPYKLQVGGTLMISAVTVLVTLVSLLILVPSNGWVMNKRIGWTLIGIWTVGTVFNLVVETTGVWTDVR